MTALQIDERRFYAELGSMIVQKRKELGWDQCRVAQYVGCCEATIMEYEHGQMNSANSFVKIARALEMDPADLLRKAAVAAGPNDLFEISSNNSPDPEDDDDEVIEPQDYTGDYDLENEGDAEDE